MGFLDEISGLFSNTESLFQSSDQKSDQPSMSVLNSVTGGAVHFARSAVVEGLSFIPGVGSYALLGKTFWSLYRGQYSESITNVEALISYLPFGALEQLATGAYSLFTGKSATTKKDVSRFEAALQMAFGAFGLACDVRGFKASRLKLGEFLNRETVRLLNPFHSFSRVRVPHMEVAGIPGLRMGGFGDEAEDVLEVRNVFMAGNRFGNTSLHEKVGKLRGLVDKVRLASEGVERKPSPLAWLLGDALDDIKVLLHFGDQHNAGRILHSVENALELPGLKPEMASAYIHFANREALLAQRNWVDTLNPVDTRVMGLSDLTRNASLQAIMSSQSYKKIDLALSNDQIPTWGNPILTPYDYYRAMKGNGWLGSISGNMGAVLNKEMRDLPQGRAYILGGGDGQEALFLGRYPQVFTDVLSLDSSFLSTRRVSAIHPRLSGEENLSSIRGVQADIVGYDYPVRQTNLAVSHHVLEHLLPEQRHQLGRKLKDTLMPGGKAVISLYRAEGSRFELFTQLPDIAQRESGNLFRFRTVLSDGTEINVPSYYFNQTEIEAEWRSMGFTLQEGFQLDFEHRLTEDSYGYMESFVVINRV